ncbi:lantibiotic dehydratase [Streptomyces sp. NPDC004610]|uniref:lantibiotic dehydratase n=1 Tax=unclassified Streptomyces TaxID=2593676 RepID=UPI0033A59209
MTDSRTGGCTTGGCCPDGCSCAPEPASPPSSPTHGTALLRVAGLPAAVWAAAGNPALSARAAAHHRARHDLADRARALADDLGTTVVPRLPAGTAPRGAVLALRRRLHSGAAPGPADDRLLTGVAEVPPALRHRARELYEADRALAEEYEALGAATAKEWERVGALCWDAVRTRPVLRVFLDSTAPELTGTAERRLARGEHWSSPRLRKTCTFLWRALARAAAKTTPRDWVGQLAAVPVVPSLPGALDAVGPPPSLPGALDAVGPPPSLPGALDAVGPPPPFIPGALDAVGPPPPFIPAARDATGPLPPLPLIPPGARLTDLAAEVSHNVHTLRTRLGALDLTTADPATPIVVTALHFTTPTATPTANPSGTSGATLTPGTTPTGTPGAIPPGTPGPTPTHLTCGVLDPDRPGTLRRVQLVRTRPLDAVVARLAAGPRALGEIEAELLGGVTGDRAEAAGRALRDFLAHLHRLGVLESCAAPRRVHSGWTAPGAALPHPTPWPGGSAAVPGDWFLDSYRRAETPGRRPLTVPAEAADAVHAALRTVARIDALRRADGAEPPGDRPAPLPGLTTGPRPLSSFLTALDEPGPGEARPTATTTVVASLYSGWPPARTPDSGYAQLLAHLARHLDAESVDLDDDLLDRMGAPKAQESLPPWPLDCLVRPLAAGGGSLAVLESASPAGVLDARFADTLDALTPGGYDNTARYRAFLAAVERAARVRFVEVLVPPLAERAANAVRRPRLTSLWTGDPDPAPYHGTLAPDGARHLPLDRITLRREGDRVVAEADGVRIVPLHHATRTPMPPYDQLLRVLLTARHPGTAGILRLDGLAAAFPAADRVPRLTVGGGRVVVAPATHRVPDALLWDPEADDRDKLIHLAALRARTGIPRHGFVRPSPAPDRPPASQTPMDFDALPALRTLDRLRAQHDRGGLLIEEALPAPGGHPLADPAHPGDDGRAAGSAAQLLLRSPYLPDAVDALVDAASAALRG